MISKLELSQENPSVIITGKLIAMIIPENTSFNEIRLETRDYKILECRDISNGYYPLRIQAITLDGSSVFSVFDNFYLKDDSVTMSCQVSEGIPTRIILICEVEEGGVIG